MWWNIITKSRKIIFRKIQSQNYPKVALLKRKRNLEKASKVSGIIIR